LVEDDADLREAMAAALAADGHDVEVAADGHAALEALGSRTNDLVLLDVALGAGPDGVEVCRRLRRADTDVYVMMLTARDGEAEVVLALEAGADDYVTKPVGIAELRSRVRAALRRLQSSARPGAAPRVGLRVRLAVALVATSVATLAAATATMAPLIAHRLEAERLADLRGLARAFRPQLRGLPDDDLRPHSRQLARIAAQMQKR